MQAPRHLNCPLTAHVSAVYSRLTATKDGPMREYGVHHVQGFLMGRPRPLVEAGAA